MSHSPTKSPNKSPSRTPVRSPNKTPSRTPARSPNKSPRTPNKTPAMSPNKTPRTPNSPNYVEGHSYVTKMKSSNVNGGKFKPGTMVIQISRILSNPNRSQRQRNIKYMTQRQALKSALKHPKRANNNWTFNNKSNKNINNKWEKILQNAQNNPKFIFKHQMFNVKRNSVFKPLHSEISRAQVQTVKIV